MNNCIFCKIINKELPVSLVFEDNICLAFLDINPIAEGHVLVIPKQHHERFVLLNNETVGHLFKIGQKVLKAIEDSDIRCEGANLFLSDGTVAGQEVMHSHLHIVPRFKNDNQKVGFIHSDSIQYPRKRLDEIATKISQLID
jgi:histidine triad (HIT) family protein